MRQHCSLTVGGRPSYYMKLEHMTYASNPQEAARMAWKGCADPAIQGTGASCDSRLCAVVVATERKKGEADSTATSTSHSRPTAHRPSTADTDVTTVRTQIEGP